FREGGPANMSALVRGLAGLAGQDTSVASPVSVPKAGYYQSGLGVAEEPDLSMVGAPVVPILFYRSMLLAADVAPIDALAEALRSQGLAAVPVFVSSLK
ncbi:cobaltochelatase subunit CobN, partial [Mesorhizobium sp. M5C.F.Ca.ET.164.01.1.1]|uniref:cobaltochelatase subunit CobN n=1 Tax=Mesorhizobium sp. M5C.F.Ca.ET.164.01.1.1 TaxID=2563957 RepID=UPI00109398EA